MYAHCCTGYPSSHKIKHDKHKSIYFTTVLFIQNSKDECSVDVYMVNGCKFQSRQQPVCKVKIVGGRTRRLPFVKLVANYDQSTGHWSL